MKQSHPMFWAAGWAGVIAGTLLAAIGLFSSSELLNLAGGYGLMVAGCGLYLIAGLWLRQMVATRRMSRPEPTERAERIPAAKQAITPR